MLCKLALRNVKRQIGNYLIYFITVSLTVAFMFAVNNMIFDGRILAKAGAIAEFKALLIGITVFVSAVVSLVLGYAASYMLKLRKREFGTYLTLGMTRTNILALFLTESLMLCAASLCTGILLGLGVYQAVVAIVCEVMEVSFAVAPYSLKGLILTVALTLGLFALSSVYSALYLRFARIYELLGSARKNERAVRFPLVWLTLAIISLVAIVVCCAVFYNTLIAALESKSDIGNQAMLALLGAAVFVVLFHISAALGIVPVLLKSKKLKCRGTATFTLRQLSSRLGSNALLAGGLAALIAFAVIMANVSFAQKINNEEMLEKEYPYDIYAQVEQGVSPISVDSADEAINRYTSVKQKIKYAIYTSGENYLHGFTPFSDEGYDGMLSDEFISESDYNKLYVPLGYERAALGSGYKIITDRKEVKNSDFSHAELKLNEKTAVFGGFCDAPLLQRGFFIAVIPDAMAEGLEEQYECAAYRTDGKSYDAVALRSELEYVRETHGGWSLMCCDYSIREYARIVHNADNAVVIVAALYVAVVFVFLAMAILSLKTLSSLSEEKRKYDILRKIGTGREQCGKSLFVQIFSFFFLPFALPVLLTVPAAMSCCAAMRYSGLGSAVAETVLTSLGIAAVFVAVYALYFAATYILAKRAVLYGGSSA